MAVGKTVCVTGASGFIASWLVKMLLERGYTVKGTIRNPEKAKDLLLLPGATERLQLVQADLMEPGAFDSVVQGCDGVFHTASPVSFTVVDPEAELLDPAVKGTLNVLESCSKASGLQRVVLTSSVAAISYSPNRPSFVDESAWSDLDYNRNNKNWYTLSKILAEQAAWDYAKKHNLDLVVINPSGVFGPVLQDSVTMGNQIIRDILNGTTKVFPNQVFGLVGVKDVAMAHILAYEKPEAEGRFICNERVLHIGDLTALLADLYPHYPVVAKDVDETTPRLDVYTLSKEKIKRLGLTFEPIEDVIHDLVASLKDRKLLA